MPPELVLKIDHKALSNADGAFVALQARCMHSKIEKITGVIVLPQEILLST